MEERRRPQARNMQHYWQGEVQGECPGGKNEFRWVQYQVPRTPGRGLWGDKLPDFTNVSCMIIFYRLQQRTDTFHRNALHMPRQCPCVDWAPVNGHGIKKDMTKGRSVHSNYTQETFSHFLLVVVTQIDSYYLSELWISTLKKHLPFWSLSW